MNKALDNQGIDKKGLAERLELSDRWTQSQHTLPRDRWSKAPSCDLFGAAKATVVHLQDCWRRLVVDFHHARQR